MDREAKEYLDARIEAAMAVSLKEYIDTRLTAVAHSTGLASNVLEKRLDSMNEFRDQLKDQAKTFVTRMELDALINRVNAIERAAISRPEHIALVDRTGLLETNQAELRGKASQDSVNRALVVSVAGLFIGASGWAALVIHFISTVR